MMHVDCCMQALGHHADLNIEEQRILRSVLMLRHKGRSDQVLHHYLKRPPPQWQEQTRWYQAEQRKAATKQSDT